MCVLNQNENNSSYVPKANTWNMVASVAPTHPTCEANVNKKKIYHTEQIRSRAISCLLSLYQALLPPLMLQANQRYCFTLTITVFWIIFCFISLTYSTVQLWEGSFFFIVCNRILYRYVQNACMVNKCYCLGTIYQLQRMKMIVERKLMVMVKEWKIYL